MEKFYYQILRHFNSYPDKEISEKIKEYFKIHLFLMYLRKENRVLEYKNSSVHQTINFDTNIKDICTYNYYDKYINSDYLFGENGSKNVIIFLRKIYHLKMNYLISEIFIMNLAKILNIEIF